MRYEDPASAAARLHKRLSANPKGLPVVVGMCEDMVCAREATTNGRVRKSLPHRKVWIEGGSTIEAIQAALLDILPAVADQVRTAMAKGRKPTRKPNSRHGWAGKK
jgi:hypothetical protein